MSRDFNPARRAVLKYGALSAASLALWPDHATAVAMPASQPLAELGYAQVRLAPGPLERQVRDNHRLLLNIQGWSE